MSLINDQQKKNAGVKETEVKPIKTSALPTLTPDSSTPEAAPTSESASFASPTYVQPEQQLPVIPGDEQAPVEQITVQPTPTPVNEPLIGEEDVLDFAPIAPVEIQKAPDKVIPETLPLWQDTTQQLGLGAQLKPEIANTTLPTFSLSAPSNNSTLNQAFESNYGAINRFNSQAKEQYQRAQQTEAELNKRGALPNTPDATKRWYSAPLGFLGDVLFGTERARKLSEAGIPDAGAASFGRAGAGLGGQINYALGVLPNLFVGAVGEINAAAANTLQNFGVDKKTAEGFVRNGFLQFLPDNSPLKPSNVLNFNFDEANKRNLLVDAIAGDPLNDVNDPDGSVKYGRIYTRGQRKEGSSATSDPVGFALQVGTYLFNPGEIPGDHLIGLGVSKLFNTLRKPATKVTGEIVQNLPALPSSAMRREGTLAQEAEAARTATAGRRLQTPTPTPEANIGFDLSALTEEQTRRLNTGTPRLSGFVEQQRAALPSTGELTLADRSTRGLNAAQESVSELNPPRLDGGEARLEGGAIEFVNTEANLDLPRLDYGEASLEYPTFANKPTAANPTVLPRAYLGEGQVTKSALPPVFDASEVPDVKESYLLPYSTPAKVALDIGIGRAGIRLEKPGALALRPLSQVLQTIEEADPKLLQDFEGTSWGELKDHLSTKVDDIGEFSSIGEDLTQSGALTQKFKEIDQASFAEKQKIKESLAGENKADVLTEKFIAARTLKGEDQINASFEFSRIQKQELQGRGDELNSFVLRGIYDTPEAVNVIRRKLDSLVTDKTRLDELTDLAIGSFKTDEQSKFDFGVLFKQLAKGKLDEYNRFRTGEFWKEPEIKGLVKSKFSELLSTEKKQVDLVGLLENRTTAKPVSLLEDDLLTAAEELAQHKLALEKPLQQLDQLFEDTVDFGRRTVDEVAFDIVDPTVAMRAVENGGILKLVPNIFVDNSKEGLRVRDAWLAGNYDFLTQYAKKKGFTFDELLKGVVERNNTYITQANKVVGVAPSEALTTVEGSLYHGTALDQWTPPQNLYVNGSRGELGGGTYYTFDKNTAVDYAKARVGDNVNPKTMDYDINPTVAEVEPRFTATLDARKPLAKQLLRDVFKDLPPEVFKRFTTAVNKKKKPIPYLQLRTLMEESFVKAGVEPTEEILQQADADISKNLRRLGFDSVVDKESGFVLSLDNSRVAVKTLENVPTPNTIEATTARFNVDSFASKHYPDLLTTTANLQDSTYKTLSQLRDTVDKKLSQVQDDIIQRGLPEQDTILPKVEDTSNKPQSFLETAAELSDDGVCGL